MTKLWVLDVKEKKKWVPVSFRDRKVGYCNHRAELGSLSFISQICKEYKPLIPSSK